MLNYIPHPSNGRLVGGALRLRIECGSAGYGVYWMLLELLRDAEDYRVQNNPRALAFAINEPDVALVERVISDLSLFEVDSEGLLFSPWLLDQMSAYDTKKEKLRAAGRRGAAARYSHSDKGDGQAIATPSMDDGQAIATKPNITLPNEHDVTNPTGEVGSDWRDVLSMDSPKVSADYLDALCQTQPEGHACGYVAQVCIHYGMSQAVCDFILQHTNNAEVANPTYQKFVALTKRIRAEKWQPNMPANFFLAKLFG